MNTLRLGLRQNQLAYAPGEEIVGAAQWELEAPAERGEIRLFWYTMGKGTQDVGIMDTVHLDFPAQAGVREFRFTAPAAPYSFSGQLISVLWAIELVLQPKDRCERVEIVIAPQRTEVVLPRL